VNVGFCEKMEITCVPRQRPSHATGWEPLIDLKCEKCLTTSWSIAWSAVIS